MFKNLRFYTIGNNFVLSKNMAGPTPLWRVAEDINRRHLMPLVFRIE